MKAFQDRAKRTGVKPGPLLSKPKLKAQDAPYLDGYYTLSASRPQGLNGPANIPVSEILAYVNLVGIENVEERLKFLRHVQLLDSAFMEHMRANTPQPNPAIPAKR